MQSPETKALGFDAGFRSSYLFAYVFGILFTLSCFCFHKTESDVEYYHFQGIGTYNTQKLVPHEAYHIGCSCYEVRRFYTLRTFLARMFLDRLAALQMHFLQLCMPITVNMNKRRC
jgi:hypothetical protein